MRQIAQRTRRQARRLNSLPVLTTENDCARPARYCTGLLTSTTSCSCSSFSARSTASTCPRSISIAAIWRGSLIATLNCEAAVRVGPRVDRGHGERRVRGQHRQLAPGEPVGGTPALRGAIDGFIAPAHVSQARDVPQRITSPKAIEAYFEQKTKTLNNFQKAIIRKRWATMEELMSAEERKARIAASIIHDFDTKPRLNNDRGTAILVAASIYDACHYYRIFQGKPFGQYCGIITSFEPQPGAIVLEPPAGLLPPVAVAPPIGPHPRNRVPLTCCLYPSSSPRHIP